MTTSTVGAVAGLERRAFFILNPQASRGGGRGQETVLGDAARALGWNVQVQSTTRAGHEVELARRAAHDGWPLVVAVGGDGTVHGVANGVLQAGMDTVLGHVPIGTGNDFAKLLAMSPGDVAGGVGRVLRGRIRRFDVGRIGTEYFVNGLGVGFDAEVVRHTLAMPRLKGFLLYLVSVYRTFWKFEPVDLDVQSTEHAESGPMMMLEVAIGTSAGGGFTLTPDAQPDDGVFDVCIIRRVTSWQFLRWVPRVIRGTHTTLHPVTMFRTTALTVRTQSRPLALHLDGEFRLPDQPEIRVEIVPRALSVVCAS